VLELEVHGEGVHGVVHGTALTLHADAHEVRVEASDGGGAGALPLRSDAPVERVRVARRADAYAVLVTQRGHGQTATVIDRAGVRLDDELRARLFDRIPWLGLLFMVASLLVTALVQLPLLANLGAEAAGAERRMASAQAARRALLGCLALLPLSMGSLWLAIRAAFG